MISYVLETGARTVDSEKKWPDPDQCSQPNIIPILAILVIFMFREKSHTCHGAEAFAFATRI